MEENNEEFYIRENNNAEQFNNKSVYFRWGFTAFLVIVAVILFYLIIVNFSLIMQWLGFMCKVLTPVIDGCIIAYLLSPLINYIEKRIYAKWNPGKKARQRVRIGVIVFLLAGFIFLIYQLFALVIPEIAANILSIKDNSGAYIDQIDVWVNDFYNKNPEMGKNLDELWENYSDKAFDWVNDNFIPNMTDFRDFLVSLTSRIVTALKALFNFIIGIIISVYLMYNKEVFAGQAKKIVYSIFKRDFANVVIHNARFTNKIFNGFIVGKIIDSLIIGMICYIIMILLSMPYPLLISIIIGITNIIPFFGPFIGAIPSAVLILFTEPKSCIVFIILIILLQQFDGNILGPKILGDSTGLQGFWVIFAITFFGGIWGILGMFIGVPLFAVVYASIRAFVTSKLENKGLYVETSKYINVDYINDENEYIKIPKEQINNITSKKKIRLNPITFIKEKISNDNQDK